MDVYTIGFTKRSARDFFSTLKEHGIRRLIDIRRHNSSQLAGYSKRDDLAYFLDAICGAEYMHEPLLAPEEDLLKAYRGKAIPWAEFERRFLEQMREEHVEQRVDRGLFEVPSVLLCSEATARQCHRRLVAEYLNRAWGDVISVHL